MAASLTGKAVAADPIHERMLPMVRQQLDALSASVFRWHGMAWPNAPMQWEIHRHQQTPDDSDAPPEDDDNAPFSTRLNLELPTLGTLEIHIVLSAGSLELYAWAGTEEGKAILEPKAPDLQQRLKKAGFESTSVQFLSDDNHG